MRRSWERALARWVEAGLVDPALETRIREFQRGEPAAGTIVQPLVRVALALGGLLIAAGVLLFVSANWEMISPVSRFALVLLLVAGFHVAAATVGTRFPALVPVLHVLGTVSLGAGIFLSGQIFNLDEHWPGGVMLWALGSAIALALLRDQPHAALTAILMPAWLLAEGVEAGGIGRAAGFGVFLLALAYFTVPARRQGSAWVPLRAVGGIALFPAALFLSATLLEGSDGAGSRGILVTAWTLAVGLPLLVAVAPAPARWWRWGAAAGWTLLLLVPQVTHGQHGALYLWAAGMCAGLAWWGLADRRAERVNVAVAGFALTVLFFYFDSVMDKMGRSASLLGLGVLFLAGGYALEQARRRMLAGVKEVDV